MVIGAILLSVLVPLTAAAPPARAADASTFDPGNIISNETFFNSAAMTADQIQAFLNQKVVNCIGANSQPCLKNFSQSTPSRAATSSCSAYQGANESAASIIAKVANACGINPQVLIVTLQKERGLITKQSPTSGDYQISMGYGCPDTAPCDTDYYGFFNQVYNAASQFQRYTKNPTAWGYQAGRYNTIQFSPNAACGSSQVYIRNQATANLYIYTPYQPNASAMAHLYADGDACSAYGNRNFWAYFTDWFGNPSNWLQTPSFEGGSFYGWGSSNGFINQAVYNNPADAQDGSWFFAANTPVVGRAVSQDIYRTTNVGEQATASVWLRASDARSVPVTVAVWGLLGGPSEMAQKQVTLGATWQKVIVKLPVRESQHSVVRLDIYMGSTNATMFVDNAAMQFTAAPPVQDLLKVPSFEGSFANWEPGNGFINRQIYNDPKIAHQGSWFAASNTPSSGGSFSQTVPVSPTTNGRYTFSIWLRNENPASKMLGTVALWGLGGSRLVVAAQDYAVSGDWTNVILTLDAGDARPTALKAEIYMTTVGQTLWLDDASLSANLLTAGSFEGGAFDNWQRSSTDVNVAVYGPNADSANGSHYLATNTPKTTDSLFQDVQYVTTPGNTYTVEAWVRGTGAKGTIALWALGGATTEAASAPFTGTDKWQKVRFQLPVGVDDHTVLRFQIYYTTVGTDLQVDGAQVY